jgi:anti-sigma B factor antagonist
LLPFIEVKKEIPSNFMGMNYQARQVGNVTIMDISGRLDVGVALAFGTGAGVPLQEVIRDFAKRGQKNIVLNLREVAYIDSSGIGDLVGSATTLRKQGGDLKIVNPGMVVQKLLHITRVDTLIEVKPDEASALEAFSKPEA